MKKLMNILLVVVVVLFVSGCGMQGFEYTSQIKIDGLRPELPNSHMKGKDGAVIDTTNMDKKQLVPKQEKKVAKDKEEIHPAVSAGENLFSGETYEPTPVASVEERRLARD